MASIRKSILIYVLLILSFWPISSTAKKGLSLTYAFFKPFIWNEGGKTRGIYADIMKEAMEQRLGIPVEFNYYPWVRAQFLVHSGQYDGYISLHNPVREKFSLIPSTSLFSSYLALYTYPEHKEFEQMKNVRSILDLKPYKLITYPGDGWAKDHEHELNIEIGGPHLKTLFKMLAQKRSDISVYTVEVAEYNIRELGLQGKITQVPGVKLKDIDFRLLLNDQSEYVDLIPEFNQAIQNMKEDGTMERILEGYR